MNAVKQAENVQELSFVQISGISAVGSTFLVNFYAQVLLGLDFYSRMFHV
jgi:hypothetical protein